MTLMFGTKKLQKLLVYEVYKPEKVIGVNPAKNSNLNEDSHLWQLSLSKRGRKKKIACRWAMCSELELQVLRTQRIEGYIT